jgi:hypothetical protein
MTTILIKCVGECLALCCPFRAGEKEMIDRSPNYADVDYKSCRADGREWPQFNKKATTVISFYSVTG